MVKIFSQQNSAALAAEYQYAVFRRFARKRFPTGRNRNGTRVRRIIDEEEKTVHLALA